MNVAFSTDKNALKGLKLAGFFEGWPKKPSETVLRKSIVNADFVVLAIDTAEKKLVGYITAISDRVLAAYLPFLEVLPTYRGRGVGKTLVKKMIDQLNGLYMIDLVCDKKIAGFYGEAGFSSAHAMIKRDYANQSGREEEIG